MHGTMNMGESLRVEVNAYWVTVYHGANVVFSRHADKGPWLDWQHKAITEAMDKFEKAVKEAVVA